MFRMTHFQSLLKPLSTHQFEQFVKDSSADKHSKGFKCRHLLLAMLVAQFQGLKSYREIEASINSQEGAFYHLGMRDVRRSTLSDALRKRCVTPFQESCQFLLGLAHRQLKKECMSMLYLLDSTNIPLVGEKFEYWTLENRSDRLKGLKLHVQLESSSTIPVYLNIDHANVNDITDALKIGIEAGATYVFDKGYCHYNWWKQIDEQGAFFVTRIKKNAKYKVIEEQDLEDEPDHILSDQTIHLTNKRPGAKRINHYAHQPLRIVEVHREGDKKPMMLVSNDFERSAAEIAVLYKKRWEIELFFKWIKQNLKIKQYLGTSENAVRIQLYTALIAYLLLAIAHRAKRIKATLRDCLIITSNKLFMPVEDDKQYQRERHRKRKQQDALQRCQMVLL